MTDDTDYAKAERLRALARQLVQFGDMTPNGADVLTRIADEWDPPSSQLERGDHVIFYAGLGDNDLGVFIEELADGGAFVKFDGFIDRQGKRWEPYVTRVNSREHLRKVDDIDAARAADRAATREGYEPIYAELEDR